MNGNELYGTIPSALSKLSGLTRLQLTSNLLEGTIPTELGELESLSKYIQIVANATLMKTTLCLTLGFAVDAHRFTWSRAKLAFWKSAFRTWLVECTT